MNIKQKFAKLMKIVKNQDVNQQNWSLSLSPNAFRFASYRVAFKDAGFPLELVSEGNYGELYDLETGELLGMLLIRENNYLMIDGKILKIQPLMDIIGEVETKIFESPVRLDFVKIA